MSRSDALTPSRPGQRAGSAGGPVSVSGRDLATVEREVSRFEQRHAAAHRDLLKDPLVEAARLRWDPAYHHYHRSRMADEVVRSSSTSVDPAGSYAAWRRSLQYDGDPFRRIAAALHPPQVAAPMVAEDLIAALRQEPDTEVRRSLIDALRARRSEPCDHAMWASYYFDPDAAVRQHAGLYCPRRQAYHLDAIRELQARRVDVRAYFDTRLLLARGPERLNWLHLKFFYETLRYAGAPTSDALMALRNVAAARSGRSRAEAMAALGRWAGYAGREDGFVLGSLLALHDGSTDLEEQLALVQAFTRSGHPAALQPLIAYSAAEDARLRSEALYGLGYLAQRHQQDTKVNDQTLQSWRDADAAVRRCLHTDPDPSVRCAAARCIGYAGWQAGGIDLAFAMHDAAVSNAVAGALAMLGTREALAWLVWRRSDRIVATHNATPHAWVQDLLMFGVPYDAHRDRQ